MSEFAKGDCVRVDIPDTSDPDFDRYHGSHGEVREVLERRPALLRDVQK